MVVKHTDQKYKSMLDLPTSREDYPWFYEDIAEPNQAELDRYYELHPNMTDIPVNERGLPDPEGFQDDILDMPFTFGPDSLPLYPEDEKKLELLNHLHGVVKPDQEGIMRMITPEQMYMWGLARKIMGTEV